MTDPNRDILYGINPAFEVVRAGHRRVFGAVLSQSSSGNPRLRKLASVLENSDVPVSWRDKGAVQQLAGTREHQGVVLECSPYPYVDSMDLIEGPSLKPSSFEGDPRAAVALVEKVAGAVHHAHRRGLLHRDLKP